jgi:hypothetical protein
MPWTCSTSRACVSPSSKASYATLLSLCVTALLGGCTAFQEQRPQERPVIVNTAAEDVARTYLETMKGLAAGDPGRRADIFYEVEREYTRSPTTTNTLRYAAALVTPGHPAAKLPEGKKLLETLLANPERMSASERTLAAVLLYETDEQLRLASENRRLLDTLDSRTRSHVGAEKRVLAQQEENARLRRELADAQQKLDAVKEIEKSIIERSPATPATRDPSPGRDK